MRNGALDEWIVGGLGYIYLAWVRVNPVCLQSVSPLDHVELS